MTNKQKGCAMSLLKKTILDTKSIVFILVIVRYLSSFLFLITTFFKQIKIKTVIKHKI